MQRSFYNLEIEVEEGILIYNILTRGFALLNKKEYIEFYKNENLWSNDEEKLREMAKNGFIVESDDKEQYLKKFDEIRKNFKDYLNITFVPTNFCNFNCPYCFEKNKKYKMTDSVLEKSIEFVKELINKNKDLKNVSVGFFGGEPLLELDKIIKFGRSIKNMCEIRGIKFSSSIITNGFYFDLRTASALKSKCNLNMVQITFDGSREFHNARRSNSYDILMKNLDEVKNIRDLRINLRIQVDKENIVSIKNLLIDLKKFNGYPNIRIFFSPILGEFEENKSNTEIYFTFEEFGKIYVDKILPMLLELDIKNFDLYPRPYAGGCSFASNNSFIIDADGSLKECLELVGSKESFGTIFSKNYERKLVKIDLDDTCKECKFLPLCNGSCPLRVLRGEKRCVFWKYALKDYLKKLYKVKFKNERI